MDALTHLVTFARVVQAGSFAAGARRLGLEPPVASKHVSRLEARLGARLLNRSTRKLSLTEAGAAYYEHCLNILDAWEQSQQAVQRLQIEPSGHLRVSALASFTNAFLSPLLPEFFRRHPKVELEIVCSDRNVDLAEDGYDLALRITSQPAQSLVARKLADVHFQVCGSPAYLARRGAPRTPADLLQHRCLGYPQTLAAGVWRFFRDGALEETPVRGVFQVNSVETLRALALAGEGLALLPTYAIGDDVAEGRLVMPMPQYLGFNQSTLYAVYLPNRYGLPKLRAFVEFLIEKIGPRPSWDARLESPPPPARNSRRKNRGPAS